MPGAVSNPNDHTEENSHRNTHDVVAPNGTVTSWSSCGTKPSCPYGSTTILPYDVCYECEKDPKGPKSEQTAGGDTSSGRS